MCRSSGRTYSCQSVRNWISLESAGLLNRRNSARLSPRTSQRIGICRSKSASIGSMSVNSIESSFRGWISIRRIFPAWLTTDIHATVERIILRVPGLRSTRSSVRYGGLPACASEPSPSNTQRLSERPLLRNSSNSPDRCAQRHSREFQSQPSFLVEQLFQPWNRKPSFKPSEDFRKNSLTESTAASRYFTG